MRYYILCVIIILLIYYTFNKETFQDQAEIQEDISIPDITLLSNKWNLVSFSHSINSNDLENLDIIIYSLEKINGNNRWIKIVSDETLFANKGYFIYNKSGVDITISAQNRY